MARKLTKLFSLIFLVIALASCKGEGCVEADDFDNQYSRVKANPAEDGIYGNFYDHANGGQTAEWHQTGLTSNGDEFLIHITGAWTPWNGSNAETARINAMNRCKMCAKRANSSVGGNCLCYKNQVPSPEPAIDGTIPPVNCSLAANQNDPTKCTCSTQNGNVTDYGVYHFPLTFYKKDHSPLLPDEQQEPCKYDRGMGLYIGLFGRSGSEMPIRVYHLFSENTICPITLNAAGLCVDSNGADRTKYVFRSANRKIFVKDDLSGNDGTDINPNDDIYHKPNEVVKLIIEDRYYADNSGQYNVSFLKGVSRDGDSGILEFMVKLIEDAMLGSLDENGVRHGSVIEYMFKAIVQDTYFGATIQICLSLYIAFFGLAITIGIVDLNKKELMKRILKIALVIFFTNANSWGFYNQIVVGFFKDGMDFLVSMVTQLADGQFEANSSPIMIAAEASKTHASSASRFSYIDILIKNLLSENTTKKIWGLFFNDFFGFLYIIGTYFMIAYFIYTMLFAATVYAITLMKLIFALAIGPFFISFSLFAQTGEMFKKWIAFLGARSLEIIILFLILYTFVMLINHKFNDLLSFRTCFEHFDLYFFSFDILKSYSSKDLAGWLHDLLALGALIFILQAIMDKIPSLSGSLVSISGADGGSDKDSGAKGSFSLASNMMTAARGAAFDLSGYAVQTGGGTLFRAARYGLSKTPIPGMINKLGDKIPIRNPRSVLRDNIIDAAIAAGQKDGRAKGLKGKDLDAHARNFAMNDNNARLKDKQIGLHAWRYSNSNKAALYDMTDENIMKRMDQKLVQEPLKKFLKEEAKRLKGLEADKIPLGKDMHKQLKAAARDWADKNLTLGSESINQHLHDLKGFMKSQGSLGTIEAAKKFANDESLQQKYLRHLRDEEFDKKSRPSFFHQPFARDKTKKFLDWVGVQKTVNNFKSWDSAKKLLRDRYDAPDLEKETREAKSKLAREHLMKGGAFTEKEKIKDYYKAKSAGLEEGFYKRRLAKKEAQRLEELEKKRLFSQQFLKDKIQREMAERLEAAKTPAERKALREQIDQEYQAMSDRHKAELLSMSDLIANDPNWKSQIDLNGGIEAYRDGLIDFSGNSLFEATIRKNTSIDLLDGSSAIDSSAGGASSKIDSSGQTPSQQAAATQAIEDYNASLQKKIEALNEQIAAADAALASADAALTSSKTQGAASDATIDATKTAGASFQAGADGIVPTSFQVDFGQSLTDAIGLKASNLGLEASNILLGSQSTIDAKELNAPLIASLQSQKMHYRILEKTKNFELKVKQLEATKIDPTDKVALDRINAEIKTLEDEVSTAARASSNLDGQIDKLSTLS